MTVSEYMKVLQRIIDTFGDCEIEDEEGNSLVGPEVIDGVLVVCTQS